MRDIFGDNNKVGYYNYNYNNNKLKSRDAICPKSI